jgi:hypothetical protein
MKMQIRLGTERAALTSTQSASEGKSDEETVETCHRNQAGAPPPGGAQRLRQKPRVQIEQM